MTTTAMLLFDFFKNGFIKPITVKMDLFYVKSLVYFNEFASGWHKKGTGFDKKKRVTTLENIMHCRL